MASSAKEAGGWPVRAGKASPVATVDRDERGITVTLGRAKPVAVDGLGGALQLALGATGLTGRELMGGSVLAAMGPAVVHLSTPVSGYTLLVQP